MNITLTNMSLYCIASKRTLLQWHMTSTGPPGIMFVGFFSEKYPPAMTNYIMVIPGRPHCVTEEVTDEKLKINEVGSQTQGL